MSRLRPPPPPADTPARGALTAGLVGARVHVDVTVPRTSVRGRMRLLSRAENQAVDAEARVHLRSLGYPVDNPSLLPTYAEWHNEIAARTLAIAVRDPADVSRELAPLTEWLECEDDQIAALWREYQDLEERLDPLRGEGVHVSEAEALAIREAAKKKDVVLLMSYGSQKLAHFATTSVTPQSS